MTYTLAQVVQTLRDLNDGTLRVTRWRDHEGEEDEAATALFRELLVEDVESYPAADLGKALVADLKTSGCLP